ncbi:MAG: arginine--tRNA ligase [Prevotellaceae bacterium]|jgi:arginyl-tRNA synthetase|nr:arginine--tRNA ligase [Prevotellaceae bacterium]
MSVENIISEQLQEAIAKLYETQITEQQVQLQKTRKEFEGDYTLVTFPLLMLSMKSPEQTANEIGEYLSNTMPELEAYNVIKGFLNLKLKSEFWLGRLNSALGNGAFGMGEPTGRTIMVEYSSPNTNKPLHLGHIRNNLLGYSVAEILKANGHKVIKANLVNDRGVHICKSMLAWQKFGNGETPESTGMKGDHLVGKYYVRYSNEYKKQVDELVGQGMSKEDAEKNAPIQQEVQEMLRKWEAKDKSTLLLWTMMNTWVYDGFAITYKNLGVDFDETYYESDTYLLGKSLVWQGLDKGAFFKKEDGSVWVDLTDEGLDQKLLLRSDGTSVYMTQDLGTAHQRFTEHQLDEEIYVVGNEQNYHFQVLKLVLKKLGFGWADAIYHLSYGMVELPEGKMKSREGTVVDADDLVEEMVSDAREMSQELGKLDGLSNEEAENVSRMVGMGALKYFILKVDPKKTMLFDPKESIDFNGNTGPFIQYAHARIKSVLRKADESGVAMPEIVPVVLLNPKEVELVKLIEDFPAVIKQAGEDFSPAQIANYTYELAKEYNQFYHDYSIMREEDEGVKHMRLMLSKQVAAIIKRAMLLLGIDVPERM